MRYDTEGEGVEWGTMVLQVGYTLVGILEDNRGLKIYRENLRARNLARVNPLTASHRRCKVSTTKIKEVIIINHLYYV